jgi:hypothetical protein
MFGCVMLEFGPMMTRKRGGIARRRVVPVLFLVGIALVLSSCGKKSTGPTISVTEQRLQVVRAALSSSLYECCKAVGWVIGARTEPDAALVPGLDWPVTIPEAPPHIVESGPNDLYAMTFRTDGAISSMSSFQFRRGDAAPFPDTLGMPPIPMIQYKASYDWFLQEDDRIRDSWRVEVTVDLWNYDSDTMVAMFSFFAERGTQGADCEETCEEYHITVLAVVANGDETWQLMPYDHSTVTGRFHETRSGAAAGAPGVLDWEITGEVLPDGNLSLMFESDLIAAQDTIPICL